jgi:hypothetical protein
VSLWVPPSEMARAKEVRAQHDADLQEMLVRHSVTKEWTQEVKQLDPYLEVVWAPPTAKEVGGVKPERYCLIRHNPTGPPTVEPLEIDGQYADLGSWVFDRIRSMDLWHDEVVRERKDRERKAEEAKERRQAREREERDEELRDRVSALSPAVSMTSAGPWSYRAGARKRG